MTTFITAKTGGIGTIILCWFSPMTLRLIGCTVLLLTLPCFGQSSMERRLECLAMVEGGTDAGRGPCGEVSRYCIMPDVWRQYSHLPLSAATNPFTARAVVVKIMADRLPGIPVNDAQFYLYFHRPARVNHPRLKEYERACRYANLCADHTAINSNITNR